MPINIYSTEGDCPKVAWLCEGIWDLPSQIHALQEWLLATGSALPKGEYAADIGFMVREDASGGGAVLSAAAMGVMATIGMNLLLSEYTYEFPRQL